MTGERAEGVLLADSHVVVAPQTRGSKEEKHGPGLMVGSQREDSS